MTPQECPIFSQQGEEAPGLAATAREAWGGGLAVVLWAHTLLADINFAGSLQQSPKISGIHLHGLCCVRTAGLVPALAGGLPHRQDWPRPKVEAFSRPPRAWPCPGGCRYRQEGSLAAAPPSCRHRLGTADPHGQALCSDRAYSKGLQSKGKRGTTQRGHFRPQGTVLEDTQVMRGRGPGLVWSGGRGTG